MKRARQPEQKEQRREAILAAGWTLFKEIGYTAISMTRVAKTAGLAKGTLYLYFKTKEELFLAILTDWFPTFFDALNRLVQEMPPGLSVEQAATRFASFLTENLTELHLMSLGPGILEHNTGDDAIRRFKETTLFHVAQTGQIMEDTFPFVATGSGPQLVLDIYVMIVGAMQVTMMPEHVAALVSQEPHLKPFDIEIEAYLAHLIGTHLSGIAQNTEK